MIDPILFFFSLHKVYIIIWVVVIIVFIGSKKKSNLFPGHYLLEDGNVQGLHFHPFIVASIHDLLNKYQKKSLKPIILLELFLNNN
jgi:hypothetical protein